MARPKKIRWYREDDVWYGWAEDQDMREDAHRYLVKSPEPGVWAGWECFDDGERHCPTRDHATADGALREMEALAA